MQYVSVSLCGTKEQPFCDNPALQWKCLNVSSFRSLPFSFSTAREKQLASGRMSSILKSPNLTLSSLPWALPPTLNNPPLCRGLLHKMAATGWAFSGSQSCVNVKVAEESACRRLPPGPQLGDEHAFSSQSSTLHCLKALEKQTKTEDLILRITRREESLSSYAWSSPRHLTQRWLLWYKSGQSC